MHLSIRRILGLLVLVSFLCPSQAAISQEAPISESYLRLHYDKQEHRIPMRDGTHLWTAIYLPKDTTRTYPILLKRTPYSCSPYGLDKFPASLGPSEHFAKAGYIFVNQDVRGRFMSEGTFEQVTPHRTIKKSKSDFDESSDTYDTLDWLLANVKGNNGNVGMYGISYPGFYASAGMIDAHPALKAVSPQAPVGDWYFDDFIHHGAFFLAHAYRWLNNNAHERTGPSEQKPVANAVPSIDGYNMFLKAGTIEEINSTLLKDKVPFWNEMMAHPNRDDFWKRRDILPHLKKVAPAVMVVTGWYDAEDLYGSFKTYHSIEAKNPLTNNVLVVGPWIHGGWASTDGDKLGNVPFGSKTAAFYRSEIEFPFFEKYLKGKDLPAPAEATVFETGSGRWRTFDHWPPAETVKKKYFLSQGNRLAESLPNVDQENVDESKESKGEFDEYLSDPEKPVPYTQEITPRMTVEYMVEDQRFAARRPDVLVYSTEPFQEEVVLAGPIEVDLKVSTTGTDADFIVKLIDEYPDGNDPAAMPGYQMMLRSEVMRGRYRESYETPKPFEPGEVATIRLELLDVLHRFKKDHRLMIQVQSTWFPLIDRNPQRFVPNIYFAKRDDFQKATHRVWHSRSFPSSIEIGLLRDGNKR